MPRVDLYVPSSQPEDLRAAIRSTRELADLVAADPAHPIHAHRAAAESYLAFKENRVAWPAEVDPMLDRFLNTFVPALKLCQLAWSLQQFGGNLDLTKLGELGQFSTHSLFHHTCFTFYLMQRVRSAAGLEVKTIDRETGRPTPDFEITASELAVEAKSSFVSARPDSALADHFADAERKFAAYCPRRGKNWKGVLAIDVGLFASALLPKDARRFPDPAVLVREALRLSPGHQSVRFLVLSGIHLQVDMAQLRTVPMSIINALPLHGEQMVEVLDQSFGAIPPLPDRWLESCDH